MDNNYEIQDLKPVHREPWNKSKLIGAKPPFRPSHVWSIRTKLQMANRKHDLALFNLAIDSKLRDCDVVALRVDVVAPSGYSMDRATIRRKKTGRPVRFELTEQTRSAVDDYPNEQTWSASVPERRLRTWRFPLLGRCYCRDAEKADIFHRFNRPSRCSGQATGVAL